MLAKSVRADFDSTLYHLMAASIIRDNKRPQNTNNNQTQTHTKKK